MDFATSFFVAMHNEYWGRSVLFYIDDVDTNPTYVNSLTQNVAVGSYSGINNEYYSD